MAKPFDVIVVGSGFGGAILSCRLAEKGMKVLVLERGRRWEPSQYPRKLGDAWIFSHNEPEEHNGWLDLRFFHDMMVAQGAGVGGGSLCYSSVALEANPQIFQHGWPAEINYSELKPHYDTVARMMNLQVVPDGQVSPRYHLARTAAEKLGYADRFSKAPLAVSFSEDWNYGLKDPHDPRHSRTFTNEHGQQQGTCIHLGNCDLGCDVRAKNGLDVNYIPRAEQHGAEVRPLHVVRMIEPKDGKYRVVFDRIEKGRAIRGEEMANRVILAAGSLGTTELLLRCRDQFKTLPQVSAVLGRQWSPNANFISMGLYPNEEDVRQSVGLTISSVLDFTDGKFRNQRFVVEDDGFPNLLLNAIKATLDTRLRTRVGKRLLREFEEHLRSDHLLSNVMLWLGAGMDAADGRLRLKRKWYAPWRRVLSLDWKVDRSRPAIEAIKEMHRQLTEATAGRLVVPPTWSLFKSLLTLHPLGGCAMGTSPENGVVDHLGHVFGYRNLIVADGAILPTSTGRNPSHTIAALAERIAAHTT